MTRKADPKASGSLGLHFIKQVRHQPREGECGGSTNDDAAARQDEATGKHEPQKIGRARAKGHA